MSDTSSTTTKTLAHRLDKLYEYDREPVRADRLHGGRRFAALFAGEHVAATEFVIGALFVTWGAGARDLIGGLILGNLLAVLSWAFICAPIAVRVRLTLYWYARRIIGPGLTVIYNVVNAMLYCCLAAAMIGVSASAVIQGANKLLAYLPGAPTIAHPQMHDVAPPGAGWVVVVMLVGAVVIVLAIAGFKKLSQFAQVCAPWMFLVFIAGAIVALGTLVRQEGEDASLWDIAENRIWTGQPFEAEILQMPSTQTVNALDEGRVPPELIERMSAQGVRMPEDATVSVVTPASQWELHAPHAVFVAHRADDQLTVARRHEKLGFWHLTFFAWFCNLAMHIGLSDMALFRYARRWSYGFYSAFGMYLGHFLAWICAGIMGAAVAAQLNPGQMADAAVGLAGLLAVLIAGWTTANPTIYRAGLALQIVTPNWPRWKVTLAAGGVTTLVAIFPAIFMQLLDFVAIYGLMLMPIGAVIVVEHWLFGRLGLRSYWAEQKGLMFNPAAVVSWLAVVIICFPIEQFTQGAVRSPMALLGVHLFYRWLPGWFIAAILYIVLSWLWGGRRVAGEPAVETRTAPPPAPHQPEAGGPHVRLSTRAKVAGVAALLALATCLVLPVRVYLVGATEAAVADYKTWFLLATIVYFVAAIVWSTEREKVTSRFDEG